MVRWLQSSEMPRTDGRTDIGRLSMLESRHILLSSITSRVASPRLARPAGGQVTAHRCTTAAYGDPQRSQPATLHDHDRVSRTPAIQYLPTGSRRDQSLSRALRLISEPHHPTPTQTTHTATVTLAPRAGGRALTVTVTVTSLSVVNVVQSSSRRIPTTSTGPREFTYSTHNLKIIGKEFQKNVIRRYLKRSIQKKIFFPLTLITNKDYFPRKKRL